MRSRSSSFVFSLALLVACGPGSGRDGDNPGADSGGACSGEGLTQCDGNTFMTCQDGSWTVTAQCPVQCNGSIGCVECQPDSTYCDGEDVVSCDSSGNPGGVVETCDDGLHCSEGYCADLCANAVESRSYTGCEYWAVDLDNAVEVAGPALFGSCILYGPDLDVRDDLDVCINADDETAGLCDIPGNTCPADFNCEQATVCALDAKRSPFAVVVSNPNGFTVQVALETEDGVIQTMPVDAGQLLTIYPQQMGVPNRSVDHSGQTQKAYKVTSDAPIVAYQFNPLDNEKVFSNDGSLLIPRHAFDVSYYAMTWRSLAARPQSHDFNGYVTVVAWADGTEVEVTPAANTRGGGGGFGAIMAGQTRTFTLDAFEVLNLEAVGNGDLTGTLVRATDPEKTVGVYAGHEAVFIANRPATNCCADHLEEMMFPTSTWGTEYAIARSKSRGMMEEDVIRVLAQADGTQVTFTPSPVSGSCPTLAAGEFCTVDIGVDTAISSNEPILVGHYLKSVIEGSILGADGTGDPGMALAVPTEQFRNAYTFLVPQEYQQQFISVVAADGDQVSLDGTDVTDQLTAFGGSWAGGRLEVQPGPHTLLCTGGCGLEVYGYSSAVSYLFAGGLDLEQIVVE
jgi:hypothetical protein